MIILCVNTSTRIFKKRRKKNPQHGSAFQKKVRKGIFPPSIEHFVVSVQKSTGYKMQAWISDLLTVVYLLYVQEVLTHFI